MCVRVCVRVLVLVLVPVHVRVCVCVCVSVSLLVPVPPLVSLPRVEVLAQSLPCRAGAQLAVDITLRSAATVAGEPRPRAAEVDGATADAARRDKEEADPELLAAPRCSLVVVALETGGRWSAEAAAFAEDLAYAGARDAPPPLLAVVAAAWQRRWVRKNCCPLLARTHSPAPW